MNDYQILIDNKYYKQIRLKDGVLINIFKCSFKNRISTDIKNPRKQLRKIDDVLYEMKEDIEDKWNKEIHKKGTLCFKDYSYYPIDKILNKDEWKWEIKTTGCSFRGDTEYFTQLLKTVLEIINNE